MLAEARVNHLANGPNYDRMAPNQRAPPSRVVIDLTLDDDDDEDDLDPENRATRASVLLEGFRSNQKRAAPELLQNGQKKQRLSDVPTTLSSSRLTKHTTHTVLKPSTPAGDVKRVELGSSLQSPVISHFGGSEPSLVRPASRLLSTANTPPLTQTVANEVKSGASARSTQPKRNVAKRSQPLPDIGVQLLDNALAVGRRQLTGSLTPAPPPRGPPLLGPLPLQMPAPQASAHVEEVPSMNRSDALLGPPKAHQITRTVQQYRRRDEQVRKDLWSPKNILSHIVPRPPSRGPVSPSRPAHRPIAQSPVVAHNTQKQRPSVIVSGTAVQCGTFRWDGKGVNYLGTPFTSEQQAAIIVLKELGSASWATIGRLIGRTENTTSVQYYTRLSIGKPRRAAALSALPVAVRSLLDEVEDLDSDGTTTASEQSTRPVNVFATRRQSQRVKDTVAGDIVKLVDPEETDDDVLGPTSGPLSSPASPPVAVNALERWERRLRRRVEDLSLRPYLARNVREDFSSRLQKTAAWGHTPASWTNTDIHIAFDETEIRALNSCIRSLGIEGRIMYGGHLRAPYSSSRFTEAQQRAISYAAEKHPELRRSRTSVEDFLRDSEIDRPDKIHRLTLQGTSNRALSTSRELRRREIVQSAPSVTHELSRAVYDTLGPCLTFIGASGAVASVAWSPEGDLFAAGATCVSDRNDDRYNRPNNVLLGRPRDGILCEIASHRDRVTGVHSTVTQVAFSPDGTSLYSTGYDGHLRRTKVRKKELKEDIDLYHRSEVIVMDVSPSNLVATGRRYCDKSIGVFNYADYRSRTNEHEKPLRLSSAKARSRPTAHIFPTCLHWGIHTAHLLAGFGEDGEAGSRRDKNGDLCVWDIAHGGAQVFHVAPSASNVFEACWSPFYDQFAVATVAPADYSRVNRGTKTEVSIYPRSANRYHAGIRLESPAYDINDVVYSPFDANIIAAGSTDGIVRVWDLRKPNQVLHTLSHGEPITPLFDDEELEFADTGIRFLSWGQDRRQLFSGSSDGVVKSWNIYQSGPQSRGFVRDHIQLQSAVLSGAFSPDFSKLLLGEDSGTIHMLEIGNEDLTLQDAEMLKLIPDPRRLRDEEAGLYKDLDDIQAFRKELKEEWDAIAGEFPTTGGIDPFDRSGSMDVGEIGVSGRSDDRIPTNLFSTAPSSRQSARCPSCQRPTRLETVGDDVVARRCERCNFSCFSCGKPAILLGEENLVHCSNCGTWEIGCLGYRKVQDGAVPKGSRGPTRGNDDEETEIVNLLDQMDLPDGAHETDETEETMGVGTARMFSKLNVP